METDCTNCGHGSDACGESMKLEDGPTDYVYCTRISGHRGDHIACSVGVISAEHERWRWSTDAS